MALSLTITRDTYDAAHAQEPNVEIEGYIAFDSSYPTGGEALTVAIVNAALATARHAGCTVSALNQVLVLPPANRSIIPTWDAANGKVICYTDPATTITAGTPPAYAASSLAWSAAVPVAAHTCTHAAGSVARAVEATAGLTAPCFMQYTAPGATKEVQYDPATRVLNFLAADNVTECRILLETAPSFTAGAFPTVDVTGAPAQVTNATDLSAATYNCRVTIVATKG